MSTTAYEAPIPRAEILRTLARLDPAVPSHSATIVAFIGDHNAGVRTEVLRTLAKLEPAVLERHSAAIVASIGDDNVGVRTEALKTHAKLDPAVIESHSSAILACVCDHEVVVRAEAFRTIAKLDPAVLGSHSPAIVACISDNVVQVREEALRTLAKLDTAVLESHSAAIVACLSDHDVLVRAEALRTLANLDPAVLGSHSSAILACLGDQKSTAIVRAEALRTLATLHSVTLNEHIVAIVEDIAHADASTKRELRSKLALWKAIVSDGPHCSAANRVSITGQQLTSSGCGVPPTHWGITKPQISDFLSWCRLQPAWRDSMTAREMVAEVMMPEYTCRGRSVALDYNQSWPLSIKRLVSHSWDENVLDFLTDVLAIDCEDTDPLFICFLSVYQDTLDEIDAQVTQGSDEISQGCFSRILHHVALQDGSQYVIPNENLGINGQGLYSRLWCAWEIFNCIICGIPLRFHPESKCTERYLFGTTGMKTFTAAAGHCGPPSEWGGKDEIAIKDAIEHGACGGWNAVDKVLKDGCTFGEASDTTRLLNMMPPGLDERTKAALLAKDTQTIKRVMRMIPVGLDERSRAALLKRFAGSPL